MKPAALALAATLALAGQSASADPAEDAAYLVSQNLTPEMLDGIVDILGPFMASALTNDLRANGVVVSDIDAATAILLELLKEELVVQASAQFTQLYQENFSPLELSEAAAFYRSETGQSILRKTPRLMQEAARIGESVAVEAGERIGPRFAERLAREGISVTTDAQ